MGVIWKKERTRKLIFQFMNSFVHLITTTEKTKIYNLFIFSMLYQLCKNSFKTFI